MWDRVGASGQRQDGIAGAALPRPLAVCTATAHLSNAQRWALSRPSFR